MGKQVHIVTTNAYQNDFRLQGNRTTDLHLGGLANQNNYNF